MTFSEYLKEQFGIGEPIYVEQIQFKDYSRAWIFKELKKLVDSGELKRFDKGIYYFPRMMFYGESYPDPYKVIERRFLSDGYEVYGYRAGFTLQNIAGVTTQVPNIIEIVTNNESTRVRDIQVGGYSVRARRSRTTVTRDNVKTLQLLELMNAITPGDLGEFERYMLSKFVKSSGATRDSVAAYASFFPSKAMKNMIETGVVYELA